MRLNNDRDFSSPCLTSRGNVSFLLVREWLCVYVKEGDKKDSLWGGYIVCGNVSEIYSRVEQDLEHNGCGCKERGHILQRRGVLMCEASVLAWMSFSRLVYAVPVWIAERFYPLSPTVCMERMFIADNAVIKGRGHLNALQTISIKRLKRTALRISLRFGWLENAFGKFCFILKKKHTKDIHIQTHPKA